MQRAAKKTRNFQNHELPGQQSAGSPLMDRLCDDLLLSILASLSSRAQSPADLIAVTLTCKRFRELGRQTKVLAIASRRAMAVRAVTWCPNAHRFLSRCAESGSMEAAFILGMIEFYCLHNKSSGVQLLARAATARHGDALFALAVLQLNGSVGRRDARAGVALSAMAAMAGCTEAMRELGHCLKAGEGVGTADAERGRRLLLEANRKEAMLFMKDMKENRRCGKRLGAAQVAVGGLSAGEAYKAVVQRCLASDCGCPLPLGWLLQCRHPAHRFLAEWRALHGHVLLRPCSNALCGRSETQPREFRQCAACCSAFYCSRSCQSLDWKLRHLLLCRPIMPSLV